MHYINQKSGVVREKTSTGIILGGVTIVILRIPLLIVLDCRQIGVG
jgi:hypothetical protein